MREKRGGVKGVGRGKRAGRGVFTIRFVRKQTPPLIFTRMILDLITFLSQCNARTIWVVFPGGKRAAICAKRGTALPSYFLFSFLLLFPVCSVFRVSMPPAVRPLLRQMDIGSLTCAPIWGMSSTNDFAQELTRRDRQTVPHPALPGDRTQGLLIRIPTH